MGLRCVLLGPILFFLLDLYPLHAYSETEDSINIRVGYEENVAIHPFQTGKSATGSDFDLLRTVASKSKKISWDFRALPWERCLRQLQSNQIDACFAASYNPQRSEIAVYPTTEGKVDPSYSIHWETYSIFHRKNDPISFNGTIFIDKKISSACVIRGHSVIAELNARGIHTEEVVQASSCMSMLKNKRVDIVILHTHMGRSIIKEKSWDQLVEYPNYFSLKPNYLIFSKSFFKKQKDLSWEIWKLIKENQPQLEIKTSSLLRAY